MTSPDSHDGCPSHGTRPGENSVGPLATGDSYPSALARDGWSRATSQKISHALEHRTKKQNLQNFLKQNNINVCCLQETHLNDSHHFFIQGYVTFRYDRLTEPKGGVLTLVKNSMAAVGIHKSRESMECLGVCLLAGRSLIANLHLIHSVQKTGFPP